MLPGIHKSQHAQPEAALADAGSGMHLEARMVSLVDYLRIGGTLQRLRCSALTWMSLFRKEYFMFIPRDATRAVKPTKAGSGLTMRTLSLLLIALGLARCSALIFDVAAHAEECFFEDMLANNKLQGSFEVISGGFLDIDVQVRCSPTIIDAGLSMKCELLWVIYVRSFSIQPTTCTTPSSGRRLDSSTS